MRAERTHAREVEGVEGFYRIEHSDFTSIDETLARAVACELDRIDPIRVTYPCSCWWCQELYGYDALGDPRRSR